MGCRGIVLSSAASDAFVGKSARDLGRVTINRAPPSLAYSTLTLPERKWEHVAIDFVVGMPLQQNCDTILTVVDKATKMCHFVACNEKISAKEVARLYWTNVGRLHGIPSVIISDRDVRFTSRFWRELWRILGTDLRMGSGFHPESSGQVEKIQSAIRANFALYSTPKWVKVGTG